MEELLDLERSSWIEIKSDSAADVSVYRLRDGAGEETRAEPDEYAAWKQRCLKKLLKANTSWQRHLDPASGKPYYSNKKSKVTTWECPAEVAEWERKLLDFNRGGDVGVGVAAREAGHKRMRDGDAKVPEMPSSSSDGLTTAEKWEVLAGKDAVLEQNVTTVIGDLIRAGGAATDVVQSLKNGFSGLPHKIHLLLDCITVLDTEAPPEVTSGGDEGTKIPVNMDLEGALLSHLLAIVRQKFTEEKGDAVLYTATAIPSWLEDMMADEVWRRLLIELYDKHRSSALLSGVCLPRIAKLGYFRDVAPVLRDCEPQHLDIFNGLLIDMVVAVVAAETGPGTRDHGEVEADRIAIVADLCNMCRSSEQMLLYAAEFITAVERHTLHFNADTSGGKQGQESCARRLAVLRRLKEEIQTASLVDARGAAVEALGKHPRPVTSGSLLSTSTAPLPLSSKKQVLSLAISGATAELKSSPHCDSTSVTIVSDALRTGKLYPLQLVKLCVALLACGGATSQGLIPHVDKIPVFTVESAQQFLHFVRVLTIPRFVLIVVEAAVEVADSAQGAEVLSSASIVLSAIACIHTYTDCDNDDTSFTLVPEVLNKELARLSSALFDSCTLLRRVGKANFGSDTTTIPTLMIAVERDTIVALCALRWAILYMRDVSGPQLSVVLDFKSTPLLLELLVRAARAHKALLPECFEILSAILKLMPMDGFGEEKLKPIVRDALDTLVFLMGEGFVLSGMGLCRQLTETLDATMSRYLFQCILTAVHPPYAPSFLAMAATLVEQGLRKNAFSERFGAANFDLLARLVICIEDAGSAGNLVPLLHQHQLLSIAMDRARNKIYASNGSGDKDEASGGSCSDGDGDGDGGDSPLF